MGGTDLSDVKLPCGGVIPVVEKAVYLGTTLSREGTCTKDVESAQGQQSFCCLWETTTTGFQKHGHFNECKKGCLYCHCCV